MSDAGYRHVYGPVPSRRLGRSLGIDLVPFKVCSYNCIYCQLGRTTNKTVERKEYIAVDNILAELQRKLAAESAPDYIALAGSGEPTLNSRIGDLITGIKALTRIPVAVLTNGSLLWQPQVRDSLMEADLVLPSLDAGDEYLFRYVNRPHREIQFDRMVEGIAEFTRGFPGEVWLEVFLLAGVTGIPTQVKGIAALAGKINAARVQLNTVSRPPAEEFAFAVDVEQLDKLSRLIPGQVEVISERETSLVSDGPFVMATKEEILTLLSRRPCTVHGICAGLGINASEATKVLDRLTKQGAIKSVRKANGVFYQIARNG